MNFLIGYKTYICVGAAAGAYALFLAGVISQEQLNATLAGLGIPALGFLRAAISRPVVLEVPPASPLAHGVLTQPEYVARRK